MVASPVVLALLVFSLAVWWHEGYWPLTWSEWKYRSLLQRQSRVTEEVNSLWNRGTRGNGQWKTMGQRIEKQVGPLRHDYEAFIARYPSHSRAMISYGTLLEDVGQTQDAVAWWSRALEVSSENSVLLNNLAHYHGHAGHAMMAIHLYEQAIRLKPSEAVYHFNLGNMYYLFRMETGRFHHWNTQTIFAKALEEFKLARDCDRSSFEYASSYAETFYGVNSALHNEPWREAMVAWEHCLTLGATMDQRDFVRVHLVRISSYLKDPVLATRYLSEIRNATHRRIASRILERTFPDAFGVSLQI